MGARVYDPHIGRFLQTDPVYGGSANAYDYASQDPIDNVDLDGQAVICISCSAKKLKVDFWATRKGTNRLYRIIRAHQTAGDTAKVTAQALCTAAGFGGALAGVLGGAACVGIIEAHYGSFTRAVNRARHEKACLVIQVSVRSVRFSSKDDRGTRKKPRCRRG